MDFMGEKQARWAEALNIQPGRQPYGDRGAGSDVGWLLKRVASFETQE